MSGQRKRTEISRWSAPPVDNSEIIFRRLGADEDWPLFHCGCPDLNEFFHEICEMPAVKIGRFATVSGFQSKGIGTRIFDIMWPTEGDTMNNEGTLGFYQRNWFQFLENHSASAEDNFRE